MTLLGAKQRVLGGNFAEAKLHEVNHKVFKVAVLGQIDVLFCLFGVWDCLGAVLVEIIHL